MAAVIPEKKQARALVRELAAVISEAHLERGAWELEYDDLGWIVSARCDSVAVESLAALWRVIKRSDRSVHLILELMSEVVGGKSSSALTSVARICVPDLVVAVPRAALIVDWHVDESIYDRFVGAFDPDHRILLQLGSSTTAVHREAEAELESLMERHPERARNLLTLAAAAAEKSGRAFPATAGTASAAKLTAIVMPHWLRLVAQDEPFPVEYHALVRFVDGKLIPQILAKTPMKERAALFRRLIATRMLTVDEPVRALAPPEILAELAEETKKAAKEAKQVAVRKAAAPYRFIDPVRVRPGDYSSLDEVAKAQWRMAAGGYVESGKVKDPKDFIRQLEKEDLDESDAELRRWKVMRGKTHVFDLWVVWVDNGSFFLAGQRDRVPVHIVQGDYLALEDTPEAHKLAADLADSERGSLWDTD